MKKRFGFTLLELLIAITLMGLVVLAFASIQRFTRFHTIASERRAVLQNEGYLILERMTKDLMRAIGDIINPSIEIRENQGDGEAIVIRLDRNEPPTPANYSDDVWVGYRRNQNELQYCDNIADINTLNCNVGWEVVSTKILNLPEGFSLTTYANNTQVGIGLILRHKPNEPVSNDNPEVNLTTRVNLRSTSGN